MGGYSNLMQLGNLSRGNYGGPRMPGGSGFGNFDGGSVRPQPIFGGGSGFGSVGPVGPASGGDGSAFSGFPPVGPVGPAPATGSGGMPPVGPVGPQPVSDPNTGSAFGNFNGGNVHPQPIFGFNGGNVHPQPIFGGFPPAFGGPMQGWGNGGYDLNNLRLLQQLGGFGGY